MTIMRRILTTVLNFNLSNVFLHNYARPDVPFDLQIALTAQGAIFHAAASWSANSIADGNLVT